MFGFYNKILRVLAGQRSSETLTVPDQVLRTRLGGKGLGTYLLLNYNSLRSDNTTFSLKFWFTGTEIL